MSQADPAGPPDPDPPSASGSGEAVRHVGGPWFEVDGPDGPERVRGREAAEALVSGGPTSPPDEFEVELRPGERVLSRDEVEHGLTDPALVVDVFRGPVLTITLPETPDPDTVTVTHPEHGEVDVQVDGDVVSRPSGHFGKGRWTVRYLPA